MGTVLITEMSDSTIRGSRDIQGLLQAYPIVSVPVIQNSLSRVDRRRQLMILTLSGFLMAAVALMLYSAISA